VGHAGGVGGRDRRTRRVRAPKDGPNGAVGVARRRSGSGARRGDGPRSLLCAGGAPRSVGRARARPAPNS
jgi:hypothetical protein